MKVKVKLFAAFREAAGVNEEEVELEDGSTVQSLLEHYIARYPKMDRYRDHIILSVNKEYGSPSRILNDGDEVSFLPPVSGG